MTNLSSGTKIAMAFPKAKRETMISYNVSDNRNSEFYNGDKLRQVKQTKGLGSGPERFPRKVS